MYNNAGVACTSGTLTLIPWDTELEDNDAMHSTGTNPSRIIFKTTGVYLINTCISWPANNALINRRYEMRLNAAGSNSGGSDLKITDSASASTGAASIGNIGLNTIIFFYRAANVNDYVETFVEQTSGGSITTSTGIATYFQTMWQIA